jgi:hypothetical protein
MDTNREAWLLAAIGKMRPWIAAAGATVPDKVNASCGFPSKGALSNKQRRIGECWHATSAADGACNLFISPLLSGVVDVGAVLLHEAIHAAVGHKAGHRGPFKRVAVAVGLEGKMTATVPGEALKGRLNGLAAEIGEYPHGALSFAGRPKQGTRMLKAECGACGAVLRVTAKLVNETGLPTCACNDKTRFALAS